MLRGVFQSGAFLLTGIAYYLVDSWLIRRHDQRRADEGSGRSWRYTGLMLGFWTLLVLQPVLLPGVGLSITAWWGLLMQGIGLVLIAGALVLHWWARAHLRHFYVEDVQVQAGQHVVDSGPYGYVRHPVFISFLVIAAGLVLLNPAATTLLMVLYVFIDFPRAARQEEELLSTELPEYAEYMQRTGRFFPKRR